MDDLIDFLRQRFDEAEAVIKRNLGDDGLGDTGSYPDYHTWADEDTQAADDYLREFNPKRMLAEVDAKRRIIDACVVKSRPKDPGHPFCYPANLTAEHVLRLLALPYADHPDYRQEWRP